MKIWKCENCGKTEEWKYDVIFKACICGEELMKVVEK